MNPNILSSFTRLGFNATLRRVFFPLFFPFAGCFFFTAIQSFCHAKPPLYSDAVMHYTVVHEDRSLQLALIQRPQIRS
jgi:hypothetical protein